MPSINETKARLLLGAVQDNIDVLQGSKNHARVSPSAAVAPVDVERDASGSDWEKLSL